MNLGRINAGNPLVRRVIATRNPPSRTPCIACLSNPPALRRHLRRRRQDLLDATSPTGSTVIVIHISCRCLRRPPYYVGRRLLPRRLKSTAGMVHGAMSRLHLLAVMVAGTALDRNRTKSTAGLLEWSRYAGRRKQNAQSRWFRRRRRRSIGIARIGRRRWESDRVVTVGPNASRSVSLPVGLSTGTRRLPVEDATATTGLSRGGCQTLPPRQGMTGTDPRCFLRQPRTRSAMPCIRLAPIDRPGCRQLP